MLEADARTEAALHYAKVTDAANEAHADCLRIITRGECGRQRSMRVRSGARSLAQAEVKCPSSGHFNLGDLGLDRRRVAEWQDLAEAGEQAVDAAIDEAVEEARTAGRAVTKAAVAKKVVKKTNDSRMAGSCVPRLEKRFGTPAEAGRSKRADRSYQPLPQAERCRSTGSSAAQASARARDCCRGTRLYGGAGPHRLRGVPPRGRLKRSVGLSHGIRRHGLRAGGAAMLTVPHKPFLAALATAARAVLSNPGIPILDCCRLRASNGRLSILATNMDLWIEAACDAEGELDAVCPSAARLLAAVKAIGGGSIQLEERPSGLLLRHDSGRALLPLLPADEYPIGRELEGEVATMRVESAELARAIAMVGPVRRPSRRGLSVRRLLARRQP